MRLVEIPLQYTTHTVTPHPPLAFPVSSQIFSVPAALLPGNQRMQIFQERNGGVGRPDDRRNPCREEHQAEQTLTDIANGIQNSIYFRLRLIGGIGTQDLIQFGL